ncbi:DUF488 domain-containing protein [Myroides sp. LJL115]
MLSNDPALIYTIGHSTHSIEEFLTMLKNFHVQTLVDVRALPGSRKFPQFDQDSLKESLEHNGIQYVYLKDLGGRRKVHKDSKNTLWHNASFRAYADYMQSESFQQAVEQLEQIALKSTTAIMCAEALWYRCHRSMIADYLKAKGWKVLHIMSKTKAQEHPYTSPAIIVGDKVIYTPEH